MLKSADLPDTIALFPLPGALLLPRAKLPLHIFEPRYLAMLEDCMVMPRATPVGGVSRLHAIGCAGRLTAMSETEDGRYMITLTGVSRFRLLEEVTGESPYRRARVGWAGFERDLGPAEKDPGLERAAFFARLRRFFAATALNAEWESLTGADDELLINALSMLCPFQPEEKQALLEAPSLSTRRETLVTLMEFALRAQDDGERLQ